MKMPKSRDMHAKIPSPEAILLNFGFVSVKVLNRYDKTCILDIRVLLNGNRQINLEMQMGDISNWTDRSVFYLCKMFTDLEQGEDYTDTKTSVHIGILNKTPLPEDAAFYNEYALLNRKSGYEFNGKFILRVLDLSYLDKVIEEERETPLYYWASVFKAHTWKELMILAEKSESIKKAVLKLHELTGEEKVRLQCEARERYWMDWQSSMKANRREGREEGISIGREEERKNTIYEKKRADEAEERADEAEERAGKAEERAGKAEERAGKAEERAGKAEERAGKAEERADKAEEQVKKLRELLEKNGIA